MTDQMVGTWRRIVGVIFFLLLFLIKCVYAPFTFVPPHGDFWANIPNNPRLDGLWGHGPIMNFIMMPLIKVLSWSQIDHVWLVFNIACFIGIFFILKSIYKNKYLYIILGFWPLAIAFQEDVIEIFELLMVCISLFCIVRKKDLLAGVFMGIAAMTKFLPVIFLPYFLLKNRKAFLGMLLSVLAIATITQLTIGWQNSETLRLMFNGAVGHDLRSQTILSFCERFGIYKFFGIEAIIILFALSITNNPKLSFPLLCSVMILSAPYGHPYYMIFLLPAFAAYPFIIPFIMTGFLPHFLPHVIVYSSYIPFLGAILLWIMLRRGGLGDGSGGISKEISTHPSN